MKLSLRALLIFAEGAIQNGVRKKEVIVMQTMSCVRLRNFPLFVLKHFRIELSCTFYGLIPNAWPKNRNGELRCIFIMNSRHGYAQLWQNDEAITLNWQTIGHA